MRKLNIVVVEDEDNQREILTGFLDKQSFSVKSFSDSRLAADFIKSNNVDVLITDDRMPHLSGTDLLKIVKEDVPEIEVILITAYASFPKAVSTIKEGAFDFLAKPIDLKELLSKLRQISKYKELIEKESSQKRNAFNLKNCNIIGNSKKIEELKTKIIKVSPVDVPVLILGESGTGKELIAEAIHFNSNRSKKPLVKINCASIPENLIESELFGHVKGAFTGAVADKKGKIESADGGTIFLDEIAELPFSVQAKLLRFLQQNEIDSVGSVKVKKVDVRVIAATNRDLNHMIINNLFREDLFYRINTITINVIPLRERKEDIPILIDYFLHKYVEELHLPVKKFSADAKKFLLDYHWFGNVRELENIIKASLILSYGNTIKKSDIPILMTEDKDDNKSYQEIKDLKKYIDSVERNIILSTLKRCDDNQSKAARQLNISERVLRYKLDKLGIKR